MATADERQGADRGIHIGEVHGAFAIGDHNTVTHHQAPGAVRDPAHEELLRLIRQLRQDLDRLVVNPQTTVLGAELADAQAEIEESGRAGRSRLTRLRTALSDASAVTGLLASGTAAAGAVSALLGG